MDGEIKRFIITWIIAVLCLSYCHTIGKVIPKGISRLFAVLPVICLFLYLPFNLSTLCLGGPTSFFLTWLANFKLLLFAFGQGPLSSTPPLSLQSFIPVASLPIKIEPRNKNAQPEETKRRTSSSSPKHHLVYALKTLLVATYTLVYDLRERIPPGTLFLCYSVHLYLGLELFLAIFSTLPRASFGFDLQPTFNEPYLATSLQDFWGRRWNLIVTGILRPTIYHPVKSCFSGRRATFPAALAVFLVSGLMHELIFYYIGRKEPTWRLILFFLVHGICVLVEIAAKRWSKGRLELPAAASRVLTLTFVVATASWWFVPELLRCEVDVKARHEIRVIMDFLKGTIGWR